MQVGRQALGRVEQLDLGLGERTGELAMESCERVATSIGHQLKGDRAGPRALGSDAVPKGLAGVLWHERLQLRFGALVLTQRERGHLPHEYGERRS